MKTLNKIQQELKAPKNNTNTFGKYKYRSCEDILEAVKPLLGEATLTISDEIVMLGDRFYVKATATITENDDSTHAYVCAISKYLAGKTAETELPKCTCDFKEGRGSVSVSAYAREALEQKGMQESQLTGATSSYARKYALNGLFCIDDTKDADSNENHATSHTEPYTAPNTPITERNDDPLAEPTVELGETTKKVRR